MRLATVADLPALLPRTRALNDHEHIEVTDAALEAALRTLLASPDLGRVWLIEDDGAPRGYAIVTFGFDLEFGGRDAWLTELWIDDDARGQGLGAAALAALPDLLRALGVGGLHLQVRPENPAMALYQRAGFDVSPRRILTRKL
jgi:GNAT superfamily N-acetyltransferase